MVIQIKTNHFVLPQNGFVFFPLVERTQVLARGEGENKVRKQILFLPKCRQTYRARHHAHLKMKRRPVCKSAHATRLLRGGRKDVRRSVTRDVRVTRVTPSSLQLETRVGLQLE